MDKNKVRINRFGIALTDAALDGSISRVQALLQQSSDYAYIQDVDYTTALHEVVKRIMENFIVNDPSRYTFPVLNKIKEYFRIARILRDHVEIRHERRCEKPVSHIILTERPRWVLSEQVTITLLQSIATAQNENYLLYTKEELIDRLCYEFVSHSLTQDNMNLVDREGNTALHLAVKIQQWMLVEHLLDRGIDKDLCNTNGFAAVTLMHFPRHKDPHTTTILKRLVSPRTVNIHGLMGNTLLHRATFTRSYDKISLLIEMGARVELRNDRKQTALTVALLDHEGEVRTSNFFKRDLLHLLIPKSNLILYDCINRLYEQSKHFTENAEILHVLLDHLDPSVPLSIQHFLSVRRTVGLTTTSSSPRRISKFTLTDKFSNEELTMNNSFPNILGILAILTDMSKWITPLPSFDELTNATDNADDLSSLVSFWEAYNTKRLKLRRMCIVVIYASLWKAGGDPELLPLPTVLKNEFRHFTKNVTKSIT